MFESYIEKIARIISHQYGIRVVFKGTQACTDGKTIYLPYIDQLSPELKEDFEGYVDHEASHCLFTDFKAGEKIAGNGLLEVIVNLAEDIRIERLMIQKYPGTRNNIHPLRDKLARKTSDAWSEVPLLNKILCNLQFAIEGRPELEDKDAEKYLKKLRKHVPAFNATQSTEEVIEISRSVEKLLKELHEEMMQQAADGDGKAEDLMRQGDAESASKRGKTGDQKELMKKLAQMSKDMKGEAPTEDTITEMINDAIEEHLESQMKLDPTFSKIEESIPLTTEFDKITDVSGKGNYSAYMNHKAEVAPYINPIRRKLERILKVKEDAKWKLERERGKLNTRSLAKLMTEVGFNKPFKERVRTETKNVSVSLLVDMSGSMNGSKIHTAKLTTIALAEALKDLDIEFEIAGFQSTECYEMSKYSVPGKLGERFNRTDRALDHKIFKNFDSFSLVGLEQIKAGWDNCDADFVKISGQRLLNRSKKRKILITLSDGMPSSGSADRSILCSHLRKVVRDLTKNGVECIGVGIESEAVKEFYPDYLVVDDIEDLPGKFMNKLVSLLLK